MQRAIFDPVCGSLEDFFNENAPQVLSNRAAELDSIFAPIVPYFGKQPSSGVAFRVLRQSFEMAESRFADLCRGCSLDDLMAILRRAPAHVMGSDNWLAYLSLGLVKYTDPAANRTEDVFAEASGIEKGHKQFGMAHVWTSELLFDSDRIATSARAMEDIAGVMRWVGKGARFSPIKGRPLRFHAGEDVRQAVSAYEARRPNELFRDQGLMASESKGGPDQLIFCLGGGGITVLWEQRRDMSLRVNFAPSHFAWRPVSHILEAYRHPIQDLFGVRLEAIAHFLGALSARVFDTLLWPKSAEALTSTEGVKLDLPPDDGSKDYQHRLQFTFRLLRTGYLRFPREHWIATLGEVSSPWAKTSTEGSALVEEFLNAFTVRPGQREKIDLSVLRPYPFVCQAPSGHIYVDFRGIVDFLRDLVEAGKAWYSSQHGDHFTLSLKQRIEAQAKGASVIGWKTHVRNQAGGRTECDLLVKARGRLYVVECKAHAHSERYFRGDPDAVQALGKLISGDFKQAEAAYNAAKHEVTFADSTLDPTLEPQFCVCTPSQQYLRPTDKFGWLHEGVPRVCTPEELISVLQGG